MRMQEVAKMVEHDPKLQERMREDPLGTMQTIAATSPLASDTMVYRVVVLALGLAVLTAMGGALYLAVLGKPIPDVVTALGSGALGALAGLLAPSPGRE